MNEKIWFKVKEVAQLTGLSARSIYSAVRDGRLPAHRIGRSIRIEKEELGKWGFPGTADQSPYLKFAGEKEELPMRFPWEDKEL